MRRTLLASACLVAAATAAEAGLEICNRTDVLQSVAIGYKGATDWSSEGWWNIEPGDCKQVISGRLTNRYYYYYAESDPPTFRGQDYAFCVEDDAFEIVGDRDCESRGLETARFREVDTGETATDFTLTLVADIPDEGPGEEPDADDGDGEVTQVVDERPIDEGPPSLAPDALTSDLQPGTYGPPLSTQAYFQGCELERGRSFCSFHADGVKWRAFYNGPTPPQMMFALEEMPLGLAVRLEADRVERSGRVRAAVFRRIDPYVVDDPHQDLRRTIQGDWISARDRQSEITVRGNEIYVRYAGEFRATRFLEFAESCAGLRGPGPVLIQTPLRDDTPTCYRVQRLNDTALDLDPVGGGEPIRFTRN